MTEVVNDALGLTQYLTKHLEEPQAVSYLQAIQGLDIEAWRSAKELLPGVDKTNRQLKEGHIKDIVNVFCNREVTTTYLVRDLSLCPGFDRQNLHLATYIAAAAQGVRSHSSRMIEHQSASSSDQRQVLSLANPVGNTQPTVHNGSHRSSSLINENKRIRTR